MRKRTEREAGKAPGSLLRAGLVLLVGALGLAGSALAQPNNECAGAIQVFNGVNAPGSNVGSTTSAPPWTCAAGGNDVWYFYVATCTGTATFSFCPPGNATYDSALSVYDGTCAALNLLGCNDDTCGLSSELVIPTTAGTTYYVRVGGFASSTGSFTLNVTPFCPCLTAPGVPIFMENFNAGGLGTYAETDPLGAPAATLWHGETTCDGATPIPPSMGTGAVSYNQGDIGIYNYATGGPNTGCLQSPLIPAPPGSAVTLAFEYTKETEGGGITAFDQCFVEARPGPTPSATI